jgi:hypothetical protein
MNYGLVCAAPIMKEAASFFPDCWCMFTRLDGITLEKIPPREHQISSTDSVCNHHDLHSLLADRSVIYTSTITNMAKTLDTWVSK